MSNAENDQVEQTEGSKTKYLLTDESFNKLRQAQNLIQEETGFTPSFKKLINDLVNTSIDNLAQRYIEKMKI